MLVVGSVCWFVWFGLLFIVIGGLVVCWSRFVWAD